MKAFAGESQAKNRYTFYAKVAVVDHVIEGRGDFIDVVIFYVQS